MRSVRSPDPAWPPPHTAVGIAAAWDADAGPGCDHRARHGEEQRLAAAMNPLRRAQFLLGRRAAHRALAAAGLADGPIGSGDRGEPRFPHGAVGSITHTEGIAVAVVGAASRHRSLGVDLQLSPLPAEAARLVLGAREHAWVDRAPTAAQSGLRLMAAFSAKEAVFKAADPLLAEGAPALRRIELRPVDFAFGLGRAGFLARYAPRLPALAVAVGRVGGGVLSWTALAAAPVSQGA